MMRRARRGRLAEYVVAFVILLIGAAVIAIAFERFPIEGTSLAIDWQGIYLSIQGGQVAYLHGALIVTPWLLPLIVPLGLLSMRASWGVLTFFTILVEIVSVPNRASKGIRLLSIVLLVVSSPSIRHIADGNIEGFVIAGAALTVYAFRKRNYWLLAVGFLLATAKPQDTWLFIVGVGLLLLTAWPVDRWLKAALLTAGVALTTFLFFGEQWLGAVTHQEPPPGALNDMSLKATFGRFGLPLPVYIIAGLLLLAGTIYVMLRSGRTLSREKAGMLICLSMLLAPFVGGNSYLVVLAIGIIPLFQTRRLLGAVLIFLTDLQLFLPKDFQYWNGSNYWTAMLLIVWAVMAVTVLRDQAVTGAKVSAGTPDMTAAQTA